MNILRVALVAAFSVCFLPTQSYVTNGTVWQYDNTLFILLGDAHIPGEIGIEHRETMLKTLDNCTTPTTVFLEDSDWFSHGTLQNDTLPDLSYYARKNQYAKGMVHFIPADKRGIMLTSIAVFCEEVEGLFSQYNFRWNNTLLPAIKKSMQKNSTMFGKPSIAEFKQEITSVFTTIKNSKTTTPSLCEKQLDTLRTLYDEACVFLDQFPEHTPVIDVIYAELKKNGKKIKLEEWVHNLFILLDQSVADCWFITQLFQPQWNNTRVLYAGQAHFNEVDALFENLRKKGVAACVNRKGTVVDLTAPVIPSGITVPELQELLGALSLQSQNWFSAALAWVKSTLFLVITFLGVAPHEI